MLDLMDMYTCGLLFLIIASGVISQGFMARAKGIPALELYRLAQKKKRKLVLCGHSLGGAVCFFTDLF